MNLRAKQGEKSSFSPTESSARITIRRKLVVLAQPLDEYGLVNITCILLEIRELLGRLEIGSSS